MSRSNHRHNSRKERIRLGNVAAGAGNGPVVALELLLLSLARTQSVLTSNDDDAGKLLEAFRREWSETYRVQLSV